MFIGRYYHNLEAKGRLAIPTAFRTDLASGGVMTRGLDGCLFLFPSSSWQQLTEKLASLPLTNSAARNFTRLLVQTASPLNFDDQGRTLIPEFLRDLGKLKKQIVVAGALTRVELWDRDIYHQHLELLESQNQNWQQELETLNI